MVDSKTSEGTCNPNLRQLGLRGVVKGGASFVVTLYHHHSRLLGDLGSSSPDVCTLAGDILDFNCFDEGGNEIVNITRDSDGAIITEAILITSEAAGVIESTYRCVFDASDVCGTGRSLTVRVFG